MACGLAGAILAGSFSVPAQAGTVQIEPQKDNTLFESATGDSLSNGAGVYLFTGLTALDELRRGLVAFDVAGSVPPGATITDVSLTLYMSKTIAGPTPVSLHRVLADWGEGSADAPGEEGTGTAAAGGDVTWVHTFSPFQFWLTPGGDFDPVPSATTSVGGVGPYTWSAAPQMLADVQAWHADPSSNFGWVLIGAETTLPSAKRFDTREGANPAVLTVKFEEAAAVPALSGWGAAAAALGLLAAAAIRRRRTAP